MKKTPAQINAARNRLQSADLPANLRPHLATLIDRIDELERLVRDYQDVEAVRRRLGLPAVTANVF